MTADFKKQMTARFFFTLSVQMQAVVVGWRIYEITKSPLSLGLVGLAEAVPALGLALYAGYLVDRSRPLIAYRLVLFVSILAALMLLAAHLFYPTENGVLIMTLYAASFLAGGARAFSQPTLFTLVPKLSRREDLPRAAAISSSVSQVSRISGPAIGGIVYGFAGALWAFGLIALFLTIGLIAHQFIRAKIPAPELSTAHASKIAELLSGVSFVFRHPILLPALSLDMISVLFGGVTALLPIYAEEILRAGPTGLGLLRASPAIGTLVTSLWLSRISVEHRAGPWLFKSVAGFGVCILIFAVSENFFLSMTALAFAGAFDGISMVIRNTAVQLASPDHMRGKISAVNNIFVGSSNELGELESGIAAHLLGTMPAAVFGGFVCLLTVGTVAWLSPTLRKMDLAKL